LRDRRTVIHPGLEIRPAMPVDLARILAIDPRRSDPDRRQRLTDALIRGECRVAEAKGDVLGYSVVNTAFYECPFVWLVVVAERYRRRRVGSALMQDALDRYPNRKVFTSANRSNRPSRAWIESLGFEPAGQIEHLDEGDPELVFVRLPARD
jgi:ribosomal protein S18 acetylase RimI-like enzyme